MSRCFPFPPPGYEKKARPDDENLLEKEKQKEKKHKKDKKEKKDKKDKQKKERSEDKHKEKKDRKEKHKDKNDKQHSKEKEKKKTSNEKNTVGPPECTNGENPGSSCTQSDETSGAKFLVELGKRIRDDDKATENPMVQKINLTGPTRAELPGKVPESNTGNVVDANAMPKDKRYDDRKIYGQINRVDARGNENGAFPNIIRGYQRNIEGVDGLVDKHVEKRMEHEENDKHKNIDGKGDRYKDRNQEKKSKSKDKNREKKKAKEEKAKEKEPNEEKLNAREHSVNAVCYNSNIKPSALLKESYKNSNLGKRKEPERNGILRDNEIRPNKLQRPLPSSHVENGRTVEPLKASTQSVSELVGMANSLNVNNSVSSSRPVLENGRTLETTGAQGASEWGETSSDCKVDNMVSLSHPVLKNGKVVEIYKAAPHLDGMIGNRKMDDKEHKISGLIEDKKPNLDFEKPASAPVLVKKEIGKSVKPPHPDSKYLSQILEVPNIKSSDLDDQEWLLGSYNDHQIEKVRPGSTQVEETKQVWAEALQIESADITALPYVIPY